MGGGVIAAAIGMSLVFALTTIGWLGLTTVSFGSMVTFAIRVWLLAHGVAVPIGGTVLGVIPLGLTLLAALAVMLAARQAYRPPTEPDAEPQQVRRQVVLTVVQVVLGYVLAAGIGAAATGADPGRAVIGAGALAAIAATVGAARQAGLGRGGPGWLSAVGRGTVAGVLALLAVAAVPLATGMVVGEPRISMMESALGFDVTGLLLWGVICLLYLPNLLAWSASWVMAAGFTVGDGTLVAPWGTHLGLLPALPIFGGLPADGTTDLTGWLALAAVPGIVAGVAAVRARAAAATSAVFVGAVAGLVTGVGYVGWALASGGALGVDRFVDVGPRSPQVWIGAGIILVSAVVAAVVAWFVDRRVGSAD
ncbi:MAG: hypothetical protein CVT62_06980 [Actinobacteria bacterium HGW-Actinobacteria-2]|nr:MAG: hypothetical protein CVT62_06980 [Actinobacteria bacterium HGW-Actinobacteria-2]